MNIIKRHNIKSRNVDINSQKDIERLKKEGLEMFDLMSKPIGIYSSSYALAHSQVTDKDPMRFFVTREGVPVINPVILRHSSYTVPHQEGCLTFHEDTDVLVYVPRYRKIEAEWYEIDEETEKIFKVRMQLDGKKAMVFQHEIDHFDSVYIYDIEEKQKSKFKKSPIK